VERGWIRAVAAALWLSASALPAQVLEPPPAGMIPADRVPPELKDVGIDQHLDQPLPLDTPLEDEDGRAVRLGDYFGKRPVVFALVYYNCPMLCTQVLNGLVSALGVVSLDAGRDFDVVAVSFDPRDTPKDAAAKKEAYVTRYRRNGASRGWHFLTGEPEAIARLTKAAGFRYRFDDGIGQFAHASAIMVATPAGRLSHYFYGIEYAPRDLRLALVEASAGKIGTPVDQILLYCFHYDPTTGKYGAVIMRIIRIAGALTLLVVAGGILIMSRGRRKPHAVAPPAFRLPPTGSGGPR
jgi:protein SCO1/2